MPTKLKDKGLLQIRSVDPDTWRKFRMFAVANDLTLAEALKRLMDKAEQSPTLPDRTQ